MASLIIDGYNLIGIAHNDLQAARSRLIERLALYHKKKGHDLTVVFDGWKAGTHREEKTTVAGVKIIYSRLGDRADLVIKNIIDQSGNELVVVTSDRDIMSHAWSKGCVPVQSHLFEPLLERSGRGPEHPDEPEEEDLPAPGRGNPRMPSRREKALARVLKKL